MKKRLLQSIPVSLILCLALVISFVATPVSLSAQGSTDVSASLFSTTEPPTIDVVTPPPTSVVNTNSITVSGETINTTSVRIYVNGVLIGTVDSSDGSFSLVVPLTEGNNTILIVAYSSYSDLETEETRIVTYQADVVDPEDPEDPDDPSTEIPGEDDSDAPGVPNTSFVDNLINNLSFSSDKSFLHPVGNWLLVALAIASLAIAIRPRLIKGLKSAMAQKGKRAPAIIRTGLVILSVLLIYIAQLQ